MSIFGIGEMLRRYRRAKGFVQDDCAEAIGVAQATISDIERGRRVAKLRTYVAYAELVDLDVDKLLEHLRAAIGELDRIFIDYDIVMKHHLKNATATTSACEVRQTA